MALLTPDDWWQPLGPVDRDLAMRVARAQRCTPADCRHLAATGLPIVAASMHRPADDDSADDWSACIPPEFREFLLDRLAEMG